MLLVNSRESKSLDKKPLKSIGCAFSLYALPASALAQSTSTSSDLGTILSISLSLFVVLGLIFGLAYIMRRFTGASSGNGQMRVVSSMMAGTKERIMVLQVGNEQHLIGVTAHAINHLATLQEPIDVASSANSVTANTSSGNFKDKLIEAMAAGIQPKTKKESKHED